MRDYFKLFEQTMFRFGFSFIVVYVASKVFGFAFTIESAFVLYPIAFVFALLQEDKN